jgi:hypothetical protein
VSDRRKLKFADADAVAAEVKRLRKGYRKTGEWSLPQMCQHLDKAIRFSMKPAPDRKVKRGPVKWAQLKAILMVGRLPSGIKAPDRVIPPVDTPDSAIDEFLGALEELKNFKGEFGPHPMLGRIKHRDFVRLHLVHCAHHFGFLSPAVLSPSGQ